MCGRRLLKAIREGGLNRRTVLHLGEGLSLAGPTDVTSYIYLVWIYRPLVCVSSN